MIHTQINHYSIVYHNTLMLRIDYRRWLNKFMFNNIILFNKLISHCAHAFYSVSFCAILWWCCDLMFLNLFPFIPPFALHHFLCIPRICCWKFRLLRMLCAVYDDMFSYWLFMLHIHICFGSFFNNKHAFYDFFGVRSEVTSLKMSQYF